MQADIAGKAAKVHGESNWGGFGQSAAVSAVGMAVGAGVGSFVGSLLPSGTTALGSILWGGASGALSGGISGGIMSGVMGGSFKDGFINGAIGGGIMGAIGGYMKYYDNKAATAARNKAQSLRDYAEARQRLRALAAGADVKSSQLNSSYRSSLGRYVVDSEMCFDGNSLGWYDNYSDGSQSLSDSWDAQSGPWGNGRLPDGNYSATHLRLGRTNAPMVRDGVGFSVDLDPQFNTTRDLLRIHPDGESLGRWWLNNGTEGCIGLQTHGAALQYFTNKIDNYFNRVNSFINVSVNY